MNKKRFTNYGVLNIQNFLHIYFCRCFFGTFIFVYLIKMTFQLNMKKNIAQIRVHKRRSILSLQLTVSLTYEWSYEQHVIIFSLLARTGREVSEIGN